jgi:hypothetical protein
VFDGLILLLDLVAAESTCFHETPHHEEQRLSPEHVLDGRERQVEVQGVVKQRSEHVFAIERRGIVIDGDDLNRMDAQDRR